jgi:hypothetical protein
MIEKKVVKIRGHHLLCFQGFQGYGYDQNFVDGLWQLVNEYQKNPNLYFETTLDTDVICAPCPHRDDLLCRKSPDADLHMKAIDQTVLDKLNLPVGHTAKAHDLMAHVNETLKTRASVADVCGTCPWQESCKWHQNLIG